MHPLTGHIRRTRLDLAIELECMTAEQRSVAMREACIDHGGCFTPVGRSNWGPHFAEASCLGVYGAGATEAEAIRQWIKAAKRMEVATQMESAA
ncbi:hypothetical protein [Pseudooceanicola sp.]|uniref:hypothetical protein n=1 Tax=Pseudooceanicola sp. TaxID=1914328 RepID=UPI00351693ED